MRLNHEAKLHELVSKLDHATYPKSFFPCPYFPNDVARTDDRATASDKMQVGERRTRDLSLGPYLNDVCSEGGRRGVGPKADIVREVAWI